MSTFGGVDIKTDKRLLREFQAKVLARRSRLRPDRARAGRGSRLPRGRRGMSAMTRYERDDLHKLIRQREKVLKSAAKQRSAE